MRSRCGSSGVADFAWYGLPVDKNLEDKPQQVVRYRHHRRCPLASVFGGNTPELVLQFRKQFFVLEAPCAHSVKALRSQGLPLFVWLLLLLPALRLWPGYTPAHELMFRSSPNCCMSGPVSARMVAALLACIPGSDPAVPGSVATE